MADLKPMKPHTVTAGLATRGRSYPYSGSDPIAPSAGGFIWESAQKMKKTVRIFGEYAGETETERRSPCGTAAKQWRDGADFTSKWNIVAPIAPREQDSGAQLSSLFDEHSGCRAGSDFYLGVEEMGDDAESGPGAVCRAIIRRVPCPA